MYIRSYTRSKKDKRGRVELKKIIFLLASTLLLMGCSDDGKSTGKSTESDTNKVAESTPKIELQVVKKDADNGVTLDNNEMYKLLTSYINQNPAIGTKNDFSMRAVSLSKDLSKPGAVFLGINRTNKILKNITFKLSVSDKDNNYVVKELPISLSENEVGAIKPNGAVPIVVSFDPDNKFFSELDSDNIKLAITDFKYE